MQGEPGHQAATPYRGDDRRGLTRALEAPLGRPFVVAGIGVIALMLLLLLAPTLSTAVDVVDVGALQTQLNAAAVAVAVLAGVLCLLAWRATGEAAAMWLGAALLVFGLYTIGISSILPGMRPARLDPDVLAWTQPATRLAVVWMLYKALRAPEVDAGLRLWPVLVAVTGVVAGLTVLFQLFPPLSVLLASAGDTIAGDTPIPLLLLGAWLVAATAFFLRGIRTRRWLFAWFGLLFFALAFAELLHLQPYPDSSVWLASASAMLLVGLLCGVTGATREFVAAFQAQQRRLLETEVNEKTTEARLRAEQQAREERAHEARNALLAIEGATHTLQRHHERLDDGAHALLGAVDREIGRLQELMRAEQAPSARGTFHLADVVAAITAAARSRDVDVHLDVPHDLVAYGRPAETGQVVQNLVTNACRYAPGSPVHVRAEPAPGGVVLRVEDEGPGVLEDERAAIFERGQRGSAAAVTDGSGLGLYVSARLMRDQDGRLWVEDRPGGGASFVLWLPGEPSAELEGLAEGLADEVDDAVEVAQVTPLFRVRRAQDASRPLVGVGGDDHHGLRGQDGG